MHTDNVGMSWKARLHRPPHNDVGYINLVIMVAVAAMQVTA